jgi:hydroxymethylglutaryl-CoA lyase
MDKHEPVERKTWIHLVECPRDAMQGWKTFIPTGKKIEYLDALLQVGFDTLDFGSFVSAKAIPQMADTKEVISKIQFAKSRTKLLAIVANTRGAQEASSFSEISFLGFPFSISETFQMRNTNSSMEDSLKTVGEIQNICVKTGKAMVVYISMGFGNPYGDPYSEELVFDWVRKIASMEIQIISIADTVGLAAPEQVFSVTDYLVRSLPQSQIGVHLHSRPANWKAKVDAALKAGCRRFDGALKGIGGCPMANDELVGNIDTALMIPYFREAGLLKDLNTEALGKSILLADEIFV